jgi:pimeloyl-ACP methyl ester carboxylesterase
MLFDWLRLAGVFSRARDLHAGPDPRCQVAADRSSPEGWRFDRFMPRQPSGGALLLLHGWTLRGKDDARLQAFARALAIAGIECVVPHIPGLADLAFAESDVAGLRPFLADPDRRLGVVGFSLAGSYALLAASACPRQPRFIATVSAYGDLPATYQRWQDRGTEAPAEPAERESWVYQKLVLAWRQRAAVGLPASVQTELRDYLLGFCDGKQTEPAAAFYARALRGTDWEAVDRRAQDPAVLRALSPAVRPPQLGCPVVILHDQGDRGVLPCEASVLADAVRRGSPGVRVEVMVTNLLEHVRPNWLRRPGELLRFFRLLAPLVQG